jgi:diguanylate cyclase (GGDEF)-like protein/PAS domain S-box-containing protein
MPKKPTSQQLLADNAELRARLNEAEETLRAIHDGEADALVLSGTDGDHILALNGGLAPYRVMVESMGEGAIALARDGTILYSNHRFAKQVKVPPRQIVGLPLHGMLAEQDRERFDALLVRGAEEDIRETLTLQAADGTQIPVQFSMCPLPQSEGKVISVVIADLSEVFAAAEARSRLALIIESSDDAIVSTTFDGVVESWNRAAETLYGYTVKEALGQPIDSLIVPPERVNEVIDELEAVRRGGNALLEDSVRMRKDGSRVDVSIKASPILDVAGKVVGISINSRNITERKQAEESLKLFRTLIDLSSDFIEVVDPSTMLFLDVNETECRVLGYSHEEMLTMSVFDINPMMTPELVQGVKETCRQKGSVLFESVHRRKDGSTFPVEVQVSQVQLDKPYLLNSVRDITERKTTELVLQQSAKQLSEALVIAKIGYWEYEYSTDEFIFNDQYYSLHKITADDAGGYRMSSADFASRYVYAEDAPVIGQNVRIAYASSDPDYSATAEVRVLSGQGEIIWVEARFRIEKDLQGNAIKLIGINQDITNRKLAELAALEEMNFTENLIQSLPDIFCLFDAQGNMLRWNRKTEELLGMSAEELSAANAMTIIHEEDMATAAGEFQKAIDKGTTTLEVRMVMKKGIRQYRLAATRIETKFGVNVIGLGFDITERKQAEFELQHRETELMESQRITRIGNWEFTPATGVIAWSEGLNLVLAREIGLPAPTFEELQPFYTPESWQRLNAAIARTIDMGAPYDLELEMIRADGAACWTSTHGEAVRGADGAIVMLRGTVQDITDRREAEARIVYLNRVYAVLSGINTLIVRVQDREELFREACQIVVENGGFRMSMVVIVNPGTKKVVSIASAGKDEELLNIIKNRLSSSDDISNTMIGMAINGKQPIVSNDSLNDPRLVFGKQYAESEVRSMVILPLIVSNEVVGTISLYAREIEFFHEEEMKLLTELAGDIAFAIDHIDKQEKLNYLAYYDVLTGLANRTLFLERVAQYLRSATSGGNRLAIGLIDLERFKNINDSLGRTVGDALLKQVAEWLTYKSGDASLLARIDADHFAVVLPEVRQDGDLAWLVEKTMEAFLQHPFLLNDSVFRISVRVGIALFPDDGADAETLFRNAEAALKKAKSSGDRYLFYTQKMTEAVAGKLTLENQLRQAIDNEEFVLHYQPKVNLVSGKVTSAEALIRWNDPRTGLVPPGKFIPILEETGLIYEVGRWALRKSIEDYLRWRAAGLPAVRIAVNVSPLQLRSHDFVAEIGREIGTDAHVADGLELEITESLIMADVKHSIKSLQAIRAMGITIAIDDFGTGFSSLNYLAKLPVDTLKIDRSFVIEMDAPEGLSLVSTIIMVAHALKLKVVAEGVETEKQSRQLLSLNCDEMQGFLFSKPVPVEIFEARFLAQLPGE